jgi:2-polyprenyl-6-methoxyphenol hydroxylase-like FAD-dependent oxidoreductase
MQRRTALISGAGVAGPALAYWLAQAGWKTTLVERAPAPRDGGYVIDFWGLGYDLAERMGLLDEIQRVSCTARELRVVGDQGQRLASFGVGVFNELTDGRYVTLMRSDLSKLLLKAATPATEVIFGDEIEALSDQGDAGVSVRLRKGGARRFDLVIGADGLHSRVRQLAFGPQDRFEKPLGYAVAAFQAAGYRPRDPGVYVMYGKPGRMLGRFALPEDRTLFLLMFSFDGALPATLAEQKALVRSFYCDEGWEAPDVLGRLEQTEDLYLDRASQIVAPAWSKGRVALIGDAAFSVSLLAGQGSALAIVAAYVLAGELVRCDGRIDEALAGYERRLRAYIETKQAGAKRFAGAFAPRTRLGVWFRNLVVRLLAIPGLARVAVGREVIDRLQLPDYPLRPAASVPDVSRV